MIDLACGTGQLAFAMAPRVADVWAVDQESDMVDVVRRKANAAGLEHLRPIVARAETLTAESQSVDLITIGNAFHRLERDVVAANAFRWLRPDGCLALCWSTTPWEGERDWQRAMASVLATWRRRLQVEDRVPTGWREDRRQRPDVDVLLAGGFDVIHTSPFPTEHSWSIDELVGLVRSTSFLSGAVLGDQADQFVADLTAELATFTTSTTFTDSVDFAYQLARRPA
jgi:SAM-dependent methyltransferase